MKIDSPIKNPRIGFKLDPGEPGLVPATPASSSTLTVVQQELHNLNRFQNDAAREGRIVIGRKITYDVGFSGSFLTVRGGHTEVKSLPQKDSRLETTDPTQEIEILPEEKFITGPKDKTPSEDKTPNGENEKPDPLGFETSPLGTSTEEEAPVQPPYLLVRDNQNPGVETGLKVDLMA